MEENDGDTTLSDEDFQRVEQAIKKWVEAGNYRKSNLTLTSVANEMDVQRYLLKAWLQKSEYGRLTQWLNHLRVEEAQRLMKEHPGWSVDAVADQCGFSLSSFHRVFRQYTGMTPSHFQRSCAKS